jgi:hypothetical protein
LADDEVLDSKGGNSNANGDKYKDASITSARTVSKKDAVQNEAKKKKDVLHYARSAHPAGKIMPGLKSRRRKRKEKKLGA